MWKVEFAISGYVLIQECENEEKAYNWMTTLLNQNEDEELGVEWVRIRNSFGIIVFQDDV